MKKIFHLQQKNKHPDRVIESIKYDIRRYLKRERKKKLPDEATFWDFDCRFGPNSDEAEKLSALEIITALDKAQESEWTQCYIEITSKPVHKNRGELSSAQERDHLDGEVTATEETKGSTEEKEDVNEEEKEEA